MDDSASLNLPWKDAVVRILTEASGPLHYVEITKRILDSNLRQATGATPNTTVNSTITKSINNDGPESPFRRDGVGVYRLHDADVPIADDSGDDTAASPVAAFGTEAANV